MINDQLRIASSSDVGIGHSPVITGVSTAAQSTAAPVSTVTQTGPISSAGVTQFAAATATATAGKITES